MRTSTARFALAAAGLAVVGLVGGAHAATPAPAGPKTLVVTDATADAVTNHGDDIAKLTLTTSGTTKKVGKKLVYTPKALLVSIETAAAIPADGTVQYDIEATTDGCKSFYMYATPGSKLDPLGSASCDDKAATFAGSTYSVKDKTITFTIPLGDGPGFAAGKSLTAIDAYTGHVDPVTGEVGPVIIGGTLSNDDVATDAAFKIG